MMNRISILDLEMPVVSLVQNVSNISHKVPYLRVTPEPLLSQVSHKVCAEEATHLGMGAAGREQIPPWWTSDLCLYWLRWLYQNHLFPSKHKYCRILQCLNIGFINILCILLCLTIFLRFVNFSSCVNH